MIKSRSDSYSYFQIFRQEIEQRPPKRKFKKVFKHGERQKPKPQEELIVDEAQTLNFSLKG